MVLMLHNEDESMVTVSSCKGRCYRASYCVNRVSNFIIIRDQSRTIGHQLIVVCVSPGQNETPCQPVETLFTSEARCSFAPRAKCAEIRENRLMRRDLCPVF